jgi:hypothetical protein
LIRKTVIVGQAHPVLRVICVLVLKNIIYFNYRWWIYRWVRKHRFPRPLLVLKATSYPDFSSEKQRMVMGIQEIPIRITAGRHFWLGDEHPQIVWVLVWGRLDSLARIRKAFK